MGEVEQEVWLAVAVDLLHDLSQLSLQRVGWAKSRSQSEEFVSLGRGRRAGACFSPNSTSTKMPIAAGALMLPPAIMARGTRWLKPRLDQSVCNEVPSGTDTTEWNGVLNWREPLPKMLGCSEIICRETGKAGSPPPASRPVRHWSGAAEFKTGDSI